jgi:hypothetical protein
VAGAASPLLGRVQLCYRQSTIGHVYAIGVMVPWFDSIAYDAVMCSLPRFYGNEGMQPNKSARDKLNVLKQTGSVEEDYAKKFQS